MTALLLVVLAADPEACTRFEPLEKQLAAVRVPLPELEGPYVTAEGREVVRALGTLDPKALEALYAAKQQARARLATFLAALARDSELYDAVEKGTVPIVDYELAQLKLDLEIFTAARLAKAKTTKPADFERLFTGTDGGPQTRLWNFVHQPWFATWHEPVLAWFGLGFGSYETHCEKKSAQKVLFESGKLASASDGWRDLTEGLDLEQLAKVTAKVKRVQATMVRVGCGPIHRKPKLRYDPKTLTVDYDDISHEQCLADKVAGQLSVNIGGHGFASGSRPPPPKVPESEWKALQQKLLSAP